MKNNSFILAKVVGLLFVGTLFSGCKLSIVDPTEQCLWMDATCDGTGTYPLPPDLESYVDVEARNLIEVEKDGEKHILLGINFDPACGALESVDVGTYREQGLENRDQMELSELSANLKAPKDLACAEVYRSNPLWYDVTKLFNIGEENVKVDLAYGQRIHLNPIELHWAATRESDGGSIGPGFAPNSSDECQAARHVQLQVTGDGARFDGVFLPQVSDPLRPVSHRALSKSVRSKKSGVRESFMSDVRGYSHATYDKALDAKIPFAEMLNSPVARNQASQINYLSLKITLTEVEGRTVQNIDLIVERDQVVDIEALKTELGVGEITLISDDSNLCLK